MGRTKRGNSRKHGIHALTLARTKTELTLDPGDDVSTSGATNTIVVEYEQGGGGAGIQLLWTPPGQSSPSLLGWSVVPVKHTLSFHYRGERAQSQ